METSVMDDGKFVQKAWYDPDSKETLTEILVNIISNLEDCSQEELQPLQHSINVDALEKLFCPLDSGGYGAIGELTFVYMQYTINIHTTGEIKVFE